MNLPKKAQLENLIVLFLDTTNRQENSVLLKQVALTFSPTFSIGDKINIQKVVPGVEAKINIFGETSTHEITNLHWSVTDFESDDENNNTTIHLIVSVKKVTSKERVFTGPSDI